MDKIIISEERFGRKINHFADDDLIDRLNNRITVMALVMCIFIITGNMYVGKPINCWTPGMFIFKKKETLIDSFYISIKLNSKVNMMVMQIVFAG
jgi:hypothetical protein